MLLTIIFNQSGVSLKILALITWHSIDTGSDKLMSLSETASSSAFDSSHVPSSSSRPPSTLPLDSTSTGLPDFDRFNFFPVIRMYEQLIDRNFLFLQAEVFSILVVVVSNTATINYNTEVLSQLLHLSSSLHRLLTLSHSCVLFPRPVFSWCQKGRYILIV